MTSTLNHWAEHWWPYVFHATWQAALIAAIALLIVYAFKRLPSPWRYALLLIALVKFAFPPIITTQFGLFHWTGPAMVRPAQPPLPPGEVAAQRPVRAERPNAPTPLGATGSHPNRLPRGEKADASAAAPQPATANPQPEPPSLISSLKSQVSSLSWKLWLMLLHAAGTLAVLTWIIIGFARLARIARDAEIVRPQASSLKSQAFLYERLVHLSKRLELKEDVDLLITDHDIPPVAYWLLRPKIMLPKSLVNRLTPDELETILAHELVHHRRNDWAANWFALLMCAAWWFNPLVWLLDRALRDTREECCDDALLANDLTTGETYTRTLLAAAKEMSKPYPIGTTLGFAERLHPVTARIKRILDSKLYRAPKLSAPALVATAILAIAILPGLRTESAARQPGPQPGPQIAKPTASLEGHVRDEQGRLLEGVIVDAWTWYPGNETRTDDKGYFQLKGFELNETGDPPEIQVKFSKDNYSPAYLPKQRTAVKDLVVTLGNKTYFEGRVLSPEGKPVADVRVRARQDAKDMAPGTRTSEGFETRSDSDGNYRLYVPADGYVIEATSLDGNVAKLPRIQVRKDEGKKLDVQLRPGITFRANVRDSVSGNPVEGVRLADAMQRPLAVKSDATGLIEVKGLLPGKMSFWLEAPGYARFWSMQSDMPILIVERKWQVNYDPFSFEMQSGMEPVTILAERGARIRGKVLDPDGNPVAGATVGPILTGTGRPASGDNRFDGPTRADGSFDLLLPASKEATYNLMVHDGAYGQWRRCANGVGDPIQTQPGQEINEVVLRLTRPGVVRGRVVDAAGNPAANREVYAHPLDKYGDGNYNPATRTDDRGDFELRWVRAGEHSLITAGVSNTQTVMVNEGQTTEAVKLVVEDGAATPEADSLVLEIKGAARPDKISGTVVLPDGRPAAGARVGLAVGDANVNIENGEWSSKFGREPREVMADEQGRFSFANVPKFWKLAVLHDEGYAIAAPTTFVQDTPIKLSPWCRIEGTLLSGSKPAANQLVLGHYIDGLAVDMRAPSVGFMLAAQTDGQGRFVIERAKAGWAKIGRQITARLNPGAMLTTFQPSVVFLVEPGKTATVTVGGKGVAVVGRIVPPDNAPLLDLTQGSYTISTEPDYELQSGLTALPEDFRQLDPPLQQEWVDRWLLTPAGKAYLDAQIAWSSHHQQFYFTPQADGSFRVDDVPPGEYRLNAEITKMPTGIFASRQPERLARAMMQFTVPPNTTDLLNIGDVKLTGPDGQ